MTLRCYRDQPFSLTEIVDQVDIYISDGTPDYTLSNLTNIQVGSTIQFDQTQYYRYNGGFTVSGDTVTLSSAPLSGAQGVIPGLNCLTVNAFDTDDVPGVTNPRVKEIEFYIGNNQDIYLESYEGLPGQPGIQIGFVTLISSGGADNTWLQLACSTQDSDGTAMTYAAATSSIYSLPIDGFALLSSTSVSANSTSFIVSGVSGTFLAGDYIRLNPGEVNDETVHLISITEGVSGGTRFETSPLNYSHSSGEPIYDAIRKFWAKLTVPLNATSHTAQNYLSVGLRLIGQTLSRF